MATLSDGPVAGQLALILAAERLFAERGIDGVALRQVNQAANQKNISAAHYHFGSKDGLVLAVLMHRWPSLDERRKELLDRESATKDLRFYLEAFITPLAEQLRPRAGGNFYIRFMQQYERYRVDYELAKKLTPASVEIYHNLERLISYLPDAVRRLRIGSLINIIHAVLATAEERLEKGQLPPADIELTVTNVIDMFSGALTAPLSSDAIAQLTATRPADEASPSRASDDRPLDDKK